MKPLFLDHIQRLNLIALLDVAEWQGRREGHKVCQLQDRLELDEVEKKSIDYAEEAAPDGRRVPRWSTSKNLPARLFEFSDDDMRRIDKALDNEQLRIVLLRDRWFRSLVAQLPDPDESNGQH